MTNFIMADKESAGKLSALASAIVKEHYDPIIGEEQNDYMIKKFQSAEAIISQLEQGCRYYFVELDGMTAGFIGFFPRDGKMYISKLYIDRRFRRRHLATDSVEFIRRQTIDEGMDSMFLNVNRHNESSIAFYEKIGFRKLYTEDNDIGNGYFMNDYVMEAKAADL